MRRILGPGLILVLVCAGPLARADELTTRELAKKHFKTGETMREAGRYDEAIDEYQQAYLLAPLPVLLFNMGQVYRLKGDRRKAIESYTRYLAVESSGQPSEEARQHVADLTEELRKEQETAAAQKKAKADEAALQKDLAAEPGPTPAPTQPPRARPGRGLRIAGLIIGAVGVVAVGGGIAFGLQSKSIADDVSKRTVWGPVAQQRDTDGRAAARNANILFAVGGAAIIGGGIMWYLGHRAGTQAEQVARLEIEPALGPSTAGLVMSGPF